MSFVASALIGVSTAVSAYGQKRAADKVAKSNEKINRANRQAESLGAQRQRIAAIRGSRRAEAAAINAGANLGAGGVQSSGVQGSIAATQTQTAANINFGDQLDALGQVVLKATGSKQRAIAQGNNISAAAGVVSSFASFGVR